MAWEPMHRSKGGACERLVTVGKDGLGKIWNVRTGRCEATLAGHLDSVECVKWYVGYFELCSRVRASLYDFDENSQQHIAAKLITLFESSRFIYSDHQGR